MISSAWTSAGLVQVQPWMAWAQICTVCLSPLSLAFPGWCWGLGCHVTSRGPQRVQPGDAGELKPHRLKYWPSGEGCWWTDSFTSSPSEADSPEASSRGFLENSPRRSNSQLQMRMDDSFYSWFSFPYCLTPPSLTFAPLELHTLIDKLVSETLFFLGDSRLTEWLYGFGVYYGFLSDRSKFSNYILHR